MNTGSARTTLAAALFAISLLVVLTLAVPPRLAAQAPSPSAPGSIADSISLSGSAVDVQPGLAPLVLADSANALPDRYIVVLKPSAGVGAAAVGATVQAKALAARDTLGATIYYLYDAALGGYAAQLSPAALQTLRADPDVAFVQQDQVVAKSGEQIAPPGTSTASTSASARSTASITTPPPAPASMPISSIPASTAPIRSSPAASATATTPSTRTAAPTTATATAPTSPASSAAPPPASPRASPSTPCASSTATARAPTPTVIAGVNWVINHRTLPAVANMSLGGDPSAALDLAIRNAVAANVVVVVAAGNSSRDACLESPAREPLAITVGATGDADALSWFSNYGSCLDLFAPGLNIRSAYIGSTEKYEIFSGTSMAAPHVAGAAALYLENAPAAAPSTVTAAILAAATHGVVQSPGAGSPNLLLYTGSDTDPMPRRSRRRPRPLPPGPARRRTLRRPPRRLRRLLPRRCRPMPSRSRLSRPTWAITMPPTRSRSPAPTSAPASPPASAPPPSRA